jgi:hypothetical protein
MICYKFRNFDQRALEVLINRELYFAAPHTLNVWRDNLDERRATIKMRMSRRG